MKVLLVNGSPHKVGCTFTALSEVAQTLEQEGVEAELFHIGTKAVSGCLDCGGCIQAGQCVLGDRVNEFTARAKGVDGFVFGSPVYYASISGALSAFMDRAFFSDAMSGGNAFYLKPAAGVASARRAGTIGAFDQMNKYFTISQMPVISSQYWNMVHGTSPEEVRRDMEGMQVMRTLARNMAWFLKCKAAGERAGVPLPVQEEPVATNFIR